jgi:hypothetical protein
VHIVTFAVRHVSVRSTVKLPISLTRLRLAHGPERRSAAGSDHSQVTPELTSPTGGEQLHPSRVEPALAPLGRGSYMTTCLAPARRAEPGATNTEPGPNHNPRKDRAMATKTLSRITILTIELALVLGGIGVVALLTKACSL